MQYWCICFNFFRCELFNVKAEIREAARTTGSSSWIVSFSLTPGQADEVPSQSKYKRQELNRRLFPLMQWV